MNILIIGAIPPTLGGKSYGGIATHIEGLSKSLIKNDHSVSLWYHKIQDKFTDGGLMVIPNNYFDFIKSFFVGFSFLFKNELNYLTIKQRFLLSFQKYRLSRILKEHRFSCIHIHSLHNTSAIAIKYINSENIPPIVFTDHGFWQDTDAMNKQSASFRKIEISVSQCSKLIYISNYAKEKHLMINFNQFHKLIKIKNPIFIDSSMLDRSNMTKSKQTIFFNGLTESLKIKQFNLLINAIQDDDYLRNNIKLIAIANESAHNYVSLNKFDVDVEMHYAIPWEEVKELYRRSSLFVMPSRSESFGLVYLEALSFGLPIVGFEDLFFEFQSEIGQYIGEPFNPTNENSSQLAFKIKKALQNRFDYGAVHAALKKAYNWENNIIYYEKTYRSIH